jgi:hypothetical protein
MPGPSDTVRAARYHAFGGPEVLQVDHREAETLPSSGKRVVAIE